MRSLVTLALVASALLVCPLVAQNQDAVPPCVLGDGLNNVACGTVTTPSLPTFPLHIDVGADWACTTCVGGGLTVLNLQMLIGAPIFITCEQAVVPYQFTVFDPSTNTTVIYGDFATQFLVLKYARTWTESLTGGQSVRVYRFLVNGDLIPIAASGPLNACNFPTTLNTFGAIWVNGFIDYGCRNGGQQFDVAVGLQYLPGGLSHNGGTATQPADSARPLPFPVAVAVNPVYITSPGNFNYTAGPAGGPMPLGASTGEDWRNSGVNGTCLGEGGLANQTIQQFGRACIGSGSTGRFDWGNLFTSFGPGGVRQFDLDVTCGMVGTSFATRVWAGAPPIISGLGTNNLGNFNAPPGIYPENRELHFHAAPFVNDLVIPEGTRQYLVGVTTSSAIPTISSDHFGGTFSRATDLGSLENLFTGQPVFGIPAISRTHFGSMMP